MWALGALCDEFYVGTRLYLKLELRPSRETLLHFCEQLRRAFPGMSRFRRRNDRTVVLDEEEPTQGSRRYLRLAPDALRFGQFNPPNPAALTAFARVLFAYAPHHLSLSDLDYSSLEIVYGFDLEYRGNHDELVAQTLFVSNKASMLGQAAVVEGDVSRVNRKLQEIERVTAADIQRIARSHLADERALVFRVPRNLLGGLFGGKAPGKQPASAPAAKLPPVPERPRKRPERFAKEPPVAGLLRRTPRFAHSRHELGNGLRVVVVPNHEVPFVSIRLGLLAGAWTESKPGTASLAMQMLTRGTALTTSAPWPRSWTPTPSPSAAAPAWTPPRSMLAA